MKVLKRDGREEDFIIEKLIVSMIKAGAPADVARKIAKDIEEELKGREKVTTEELREMVLNRLKKENPEWYENWRVYDRAVKRR